VTPYTQTWLGVGSHFRSRGYPKDNKRLAGRIFNYVHIIPAIGQRKDIDIPRQKTIFTDQICLEDAPPSLENKESSLLFEGLAY
jgi:hypothetical protein